MAWGTCFLTFYAVANGSAFPLDLSFSFVAALLYLAIPGTAIGFLAYLEIVRRLGAPTAAFSTVLYPVIALAVSTVVEGYRWTPEGAIGLLLILGGNVLVFAPARLLRHAAMLRLSYATGPRYPAPAPDPRSGRRDARCRPRCGSARR